LCRLLERAAEFDLPIFQTFVINEATKKLIGKQIPDYKEYLFLLDQNYESLYMHGSFWVNLASGELCYRQLKREIEIVHRLHATHYILHPGALQNGISRTEGLTNIASVLNYFTRRDPSFRFVLENNAHGTHSLGNDFSDFLFIRDRLDKPEMVSFCVDTAHAHVYGYDIETAEGVASFLESIAIFLGDAISLIHLNDSTKPRGSKLVEHSLL
jgi:endonuclease IV